MPATRRTQRTQSGSPWRMARFVGIFCFLTVVAFPLAHAAVPGHDSSTCPLCQVVLSGALLLIPLVILAARLELLCAFVPVTSPEHEVRFPKAPLARGPPA